MRKFIFELARNFHSREHRIDVWLNSNLQSDDSAQRGESVTTVIKLSCENQKMLRDP